MTPDGVTPNDAVGERIGAGSETIPVAEVVVDRPGNLLRLVLRPHATTAPLAERSIVAILDVGARGRLIGLELPPDAADPLGDGPYLSVDPAGPGCAEPLARAVPADVTVVTDAAGRLVEARLPRRGAGYAVTYPSGNR